MSFSSAPQISQPENADTQAVTELEMNELLLKAKSLRIERLEDELITRRVDPKEYETADLIIDTPLKRLKMVLKARVGIEFHQGVKAWNEAVEAGVPLDAEAYALYIRLLSSNDNVDQKALALFEECHSLFQSVRSEGESESSGGATFASSTSSGTVPVPTSSSSSASQKLRDDLAKSPNKDLIYAAGIKAYSYCGRMDTSRQIFFEYLEEAGIKPTPILFGELMTQELLELDPTESERDIYNLQRVFELYRNQKYDLDELEDKGFGHVTTIAQLVKLEFECNIMFTTKGRLY